MNLKVLSIGSDRNLFKEDSSVLERIKAQGALVEELHIIVFALKELGLSEKKILGNIYLHPTNSLSRWLYIFDALRIGRRINADIITTQDPFESGLVGTILKNKLGASLEVQLHTDPFSDQFGGFLNFLRKQIMKLVLHKADSIRVVLESVGDKLKKYGAGKITVLPIFVDRNRTEGEQKFDLHNKYGFKTVLLTTCRLTKEKNLRFAIEAFRKAKESYPDIGFIVVGAGPERFEEQKNVIFVGWQEDLATYYKTADIYIQTSKFEGYGLSLVEAGLSGLPVISTPVGIAKELKNLVIVENEEALVESMKELIADKSKRKEMGSALKAELEGVTITKSDYLNRLKENWVKLSGAKQ